MRNTFVAVPGLRILIGWVKIEVLLCWDFGLRGLEFKLAGGE